MEEIVEKNTIQATEKPMRQSNLELLRIFCMLLIVAHHFSYHGCISTGMSGFNLAVVNCLIIGGKLGVIGFILISGYFLIDSEFKIKKLIKLIGQVLFYSILLYIIFVIINPDMFSVKDLIYSFFPIGSSLYWFMTSYIIMYILSPFINKMIKNITQKQHLILIVILLIVNIVLPRIFNVVLFSNTGWFISLYIIASYIKLYPNEIFNNNKIMFPIFLLSFIFIILASVFLKKSYYDLNNWVCFVCGLSMFCSFKNFTIKNNKFINAISSATLGVYLIHDNYYLRSVIWESLLKCSYYTQIKWFVLFALISILVVYISCTIIELGRQKLFFLIKKIIKNKLSSKKSCSN